MPTRLVNDPKQVEGDVETVDCEFVNGIEKFGSGLPFKVAPFMVLSDFGWAVLINKNNVSNIVPLPCDFVYVSQK